MFLAMLQLIFHAKILHFLEKQKEIANILLFLSFLCIFVAWKSIR
jgi:hypothetical protein